MSDNQKTHHFLNEWQEWKHLYHSDQLGNITFQCERLLTNILFTHKSFHSIKNHLKGFDQIPGTVMHPEEVWSYWQNPKKQTVVLRNYIKENYIVKTTDGEITDAFLTDNINRYRKGVILF